MSKAAPMAKTFALSPVESWEDRANMITIGPFQLAAWVSAAPLDDKPWLLLIHGFPTSSWDWSPLWDHLSAHFNLAAIDMLGFGLSDKPRRHTYTLIQQADFQEAFLAELGVSECHILCHDYGVSVAQELLARHTERSLSFKLQSVCFLNGGLFPAQHRPLLTQRLALSPIGGLVSAAMNKEKLRKTFTDIYGPDTPPGAVEIDGHWNLITRKNGQKIVHKLMRYMVDRKTHQARWHTAITDAPIALKLINGGKDPISGKHLYTYYCDLVQNADASLLESIGHYPHLEAPGDVLSHFLAFHRIEQNGFTLAQKSS